MNELFSPLEQQYMRRALSLARRGYGTTSPNPMVGAVLVKNRVVIGQGFHRAAGQPHAEIEAIKDAARKGNRTEGATLYVTLEPCSTHGRTPPCTEAIVAARIAEVIAAATDPNPKHGGRGLDWLRARNIKVRNGLLEQEATDLNCIFNHWILHQTPYVTVKSAMTMDGKIATATGESKWITSAKARNIGMKLRFGSDAILAGIQTVLADDPSLTYRKEKGALQHGKFLRRFVLDSEARIPLTAKVLTDLNRTHTTVVVSEMAPADKVKELEKQAQVWRVPRTSSGLDLHVTLQKMGAEQISSLLIEGGGEAIASFFAARLAHRVYFFYAPMIIGGRDARKAVGGAGFSFPETSPKLKRVQWKKIAPDLLLTAQVEY